MRLRVTAVYAISMLAAVNVLNGTASPKTENGVHATSLWDLDLEYPDDGAWSAARKKVEDCLVEIESRDHRAVAGSVDLVQLLDKVALARGLAGNMARFAFLKTSLNARSDTARARYGAAVALESRVDAETAWVEAGVRRLGQQKIETWSKHDARLGSHAWRIAEIFRLSGHTESPGSEVIAAGLERAKATPLDLYRALLSSDLSWPTVSVRGSARIVDFLSYSGLRRDPDHETRDRINRAYFQKLKSMEEPLGLLLMRRYETEVDLARARNFDNGIDEFFWRDDGIPPGSYRRILANARTNRSVTVRYLMLLAHMNGVSSPSLSDLYTPPPGNGAAFTIEVATRDIVRAWAPMGRDYQDVLANRLHRPWMDLAPSSQKDSSAGGVYWEVGGGHPYTLLSFEGDLPSAESFAAAAALMMFYAELPTNKRPERREEDFPVYSNAIWFAGELLFDDQLLKDTRDREKRIAILSSQLYRLWNAYFQFAAVTELEDQITHAANAGDELSGREISSRYLAILRSFYSNPEITIDPLFAEQWMSYPFLYDSRHILPEWAMAVAAGVDLLDHVENHDGRTKTTVRMPLANPSSFTSYDLLHDAGIDVNSDSPYRALIAKMNFDMDLLQSELSMGRSSH